jgi:LysM repeat protein
MKKTIVRAVSTAAFFSTVFAGSAFANTHTVQKGDTLSKIASKYQTTVSQLRTLNGLTSDMIYVNQTLKVSAAAELPAPVVTPVAADVYTVVSGDYLGKIASKYGMTVAQLKSLNNLTSDIIYVGQKLKVSAQAVVVNPTPAPAPAAPSPSPVVTTPSTSVSEYTVKSGDYLGKIAKEFNMTVTELKTLNGLTSNLIFVGQKLKVTGSAPVVVTPPPATQTPTPAPSPVTTSEYTVVSGDTLGKIAAKYGVTVAELKSLNGLTSDMIYVGQKLKVTGSAPVVTTPPVTETPPVVTTPPVTQTPAPTPAPSVPTTNVSEYTVVSGDTLGKIAAVFSMTIAELKSLNNLTYDVIYVGQKLKVKAADTPAAVSPGATSLIDLAKSLMGIPYAWGGQTLSGFDCSGFIYYVANKTGKPIVRTSAEGYHDRSYYVDQPQIGDLVFFENTYKQGISHVGFYIGNNQFIHADATLGVTITNLTNSYWSKHFEGFKRFY